MGRHREQPAAGSLETPQAVAGRLWTLKLNGLPADAWSTYLAKIASTSADDVSAAAAELLSPERMIVIVVGDADEVQESLEEIAEVEVVKSGG